MKILIDDGLRIQLGTGIGNYCSHLYRSLEKNKKQGDVFDLIDFKPKASNRKIKRLQYIWYINSRSFRRMALQYDAVHFAGQFMPFKKIPGVKYIVTVHDLTSYIHPETLSPLAAFISKRKIKRIMRDADAILTVSNSVKHEMQEYFPKSANKVTAIYPGNYDNVKRIEEFSQYDNSKIEAIKGTPFFLFVGTIEKRKNVGLIIDAFIKLKDIEPAAKEYKLVLAGRKGFGSDEFEKKANDSAYHEDIVFAGYTTNEDCGRLYSKAAAYIFPTVYEGFGSTQLECMTCNTPLILSDIPTNREVSGDYGMFFSLSEPDTLVQQMKQIVLGEYDVPGHRALAEKYLKKFSWDEIATQVRCFYESVLKVN